MTWRSDEAFLNGLSFMSTAVDQVRPDGWDRPSPCEGWTALDVLGHVGAAVRFGTMVLRDEAPVWEPAQPPRAAVEGEPRDWWLGLVGPARDAVRGVDLDKVVETPMGQRSVGEGLNFPAVDLFVHAWDIGRSADLDVEIPPEAIKFVHEVVDPVPAHLVRSARVFTDECPAPPGANATETLIAWTGRDPREPPTG